MAEAPTPEELAAKRQELQDLRKSNADTQANRDQKAAEERRIREAEAIQAEINYELQAQAILEGKPLPDFNPEATNEPPDNSNVPATNEQSSPPNEDPAPQKPQAPQVNLGGDDEDNKEGA
ncbi:neck protein [Gordonia phage SteveFrench]|uniref:Uncharacterized protein n=2 Tax=Montyvirus stevefrench TaxID=2734258 RepID=A0A890V5J8_9CAUD|nr:neck protein [Gordonia phage SteveFrench]AUV60626.1 hypothetical protein SEA_STEVEFRENCH_22 [Gordonia phage SteveFrench]QRI45608.1 hypothetical protein SEA_ROYALG_23 [Gordonia phage RoyalG]